jgi:DNA-binding transcriptional regulator YdaS (Cro superfamily)
LFPRNIIPIATGATVAVSIAQQIVFICYQNKFSFDNISGMDLKTFLSQHSTADLGQLATRAGTQLIYLRHVSAGHRRISANLAIRLEWASAGQLTARELRPDLPWPDHPRPCPGPGQTDPPS